MCKDLESFHSVAAFHALSPTSGDESRCLCGCTGRHDHSRRVPLECFSVFFLSFFAFLHLLCIGKGDCTSSIEYIYISNTGAFLTVGNVKLEACNSLALKKSISLIPKGTSATASYGSPENEPHLVVPTKDNELDKAFSANKYIHRVQVYTRT